MTLIKGNHINLVVELRINRVTWLFEYPNNQNKTKDESLTIKIRIHCDWNTKFQFTYFVLRKSLHTENKTEVGLKIREKMEGRYLLVKLS